MNEGENDDGITSRTSSRAVFFGLDTTGNGFLKTELLVVGSSLGFFASISSGVLSLVVVRFLLLSIKIDGLNKYQKLFDNL